MADASGRQGAGRPGAAPPGAVTGVGSLRAGYGMVDITPPAGVDLTGFIAREGPCVGTLDPLQARALVFEDAAGRRAALVTCDLIGLGRHLVARVRQRVAAATGIPPEGQLFNCSHTHSGPETGVLTTVGAPDPAYLAGLEQRLFEVLAAAAGTLVPVRLRVVSIDVPDGLAINRVFRRVDHPERYDRRLTAVRVQRVADGAPLATVVAFACHAVSLGAAERHASADFVGPLRRELEGDGGTGPAGPVLYVNGCGGDVNPAGMDARGREACEALGRGLAAAARTALASLAEDTPASTPADSLVAAAPGERVGTAQEWVTLPFQPLRSPVAAAELLDAGRAGQRDQVPGSPGYRGIQVTHLDYPFRLLRLHYGSEQLPVVEAEVQVLTLGPVAVVALPGEIFSSLGRAIKDASPFVAPRTIVAGWSNDNIGYVPDRDAFPLGGYEVDLASRYYGYPAGWAEGAGDALVASAGRLLQRLAAAPD